MKRQTPPLRIFIIENHPDTLEALRFYLELTGHKVASATDLASARAMLPNASFDLLISDIQLPDGNGWDFLQQLRAIRPIKAAIAMSGFGAAADISKSRAAGFLEHLVKPFVPADIERALKKASQALIKERAKPAVKSPVKKPLSKSKR